MLPAKILILLSGFIAISSAFTIPLKRAETEPGDGPEDNDDPNDVEVLIGDLAQNITTPVGRIVADILLELVSGQSNEVGSPPGTDEECQKDPCCPWYDISSKLTTLFLGQDGLCTDLARSAIRMGFHDAGSWSKSLAAQGQDYGGADGSLILFEEVARPENRGLEKIVQMTADLHKEYATKGNISMADLVQFAAIHATVTCPLGPRVRFFAGREDAIKAAPDGLLPDVHAPAGSLVSLFEDKTIAAHGLAALLGAHSVAKQFFVNETVAGASLDSTPGVWDIDFYSEMLEPEPKEHVFRLPSDIAISQSPLIGDEWTTFIRDKAHWDEDYAAIYVRLSLLGVNRINQMYECTKALPAVRAVP